MTARFSLYTFWHFRWFDLYGGSTFVVVARWRCTIWPETSFFTTWHIHRTLNRSWKVENVVLFYDFSEFLQHKIKSRCKNNWTFRIFTTWHSWNGLRRLWTRCDVVKTPAFLIFVQHRSGALWSSVKISASDFDRCPWFPSGTTIKARTGVKPPKKLKNIFL